MVTRRTCGISVALAAGFATVLAGPGWLLWNAVHFQGWNPQTLSVRFQNVRFEAGGLVFRYILDNRTYRTARFLREHTEVRALQQTGRPMVGYPNLPLPLVVRGHSRQLVEIRLELPTSPFSRWSGISEDQTRRVLQNRLPDVSRGEALVSPLPMHSTERDRTAKAEAPPPPVWSPDESLLDLDGFELVNRPQGTHLRFPRGW